MNAIERILVILSVIILCIGLLIGLQMFKMMGGVGLLFIAIMLISGICVWVGLKKEKEQKRIEQEIEQEKARKQKEYEIQKEKDMREIIDFAKSNGFSNIENLLERREREYGQASRNYVTALLTQPFEPTYSRGVKAGSLADNVAYLANVQKKAEYEKQLSDNRQMMDMGFSYEDKLHFTEIEIIKSMKEIPDSGTYVELLQKYFNDSYEILRKCR